jgi:hypothetical protein
MSTVVRAEYGGSKFLRNIGTHNPEDHHGRTIQKTLDLIYAAENVSSNKQSSNQAVYQNAS